MDATLEIINRMIADYGVEPLSPEEFTERWLRAEASAAPRDDVPPQLDDGWPAPCDAATISQSGKEWTAPNDDKLWPEIPAMSDEEIPEISDEELQESLRRVWLRIAALEAEAAATRLAETCTVG